MEFYSIAFQGNSKANSPFKSERDGLICAGHSGTCRRRDRIIYGFHPTKKVLSDPRFTTMDDVMRYENTFKGSVQDDTETFLHAYELSLLGECCDMWKEPARYQHVSSPASTDD